MINIHSFLSVIIQSAPFLCLLTPIPLLLSFFIPLKFTKQKKDFVVRTVLWLSRVSLLLAMLTCFAGGLIQKPIQSEFVSWGPIAFTLYFDTVSAVMLLLVSFLTVSIVCFSRNYLAGNPNQDLFFKWLSITSGSVLLLVISGNLALFSLAWIAVSLSLHKLLTFYKERYAAQLAARKKFLFSRWGDLALITAMVLIWHDFGTLDFAKLFSIVGNGSTDHLQLIALLLVGAAMIKSAQFPLHGWLPDTMETPTPVSALMHAGIINAGGFLVIRLSPLLVLSPRALELLAAVGGITALFGSVVMITQSSVKRSLAFSTIAQMGFMMLQCGLGAFALALLHIVAHSLYKGYAFLASGKVIDERCQAGASPKASYLGLRGAFFAFLTSGIVVFSFAFILRMKPWSDSGQFSLTLILVIALAQLLLHFWSFDWSRRGFFLGVLISSGLALLFFVLHAGTETLIEHAVAAPPVFKMAWPIGMITAFSFLIVALRPFLPPSWIKTAFGRGLFVHAYNGFYINTAVNRWLSRSQARALSQRIIGNGTVSTILKSKLTEILSLTALNNAIEVASKRMAPLWPLSRFVAVNPFVGLASIDFSEAALLLKKTIGVSLSMPPGFYRERYEKGVITNEDLDQAIKEVTTGKNESSKNFSHLLSALEKNSWEESQDLSSKLLLSSCIDAEQGTRWSLFVSEEISKWCVSFFDKGQALWHSPWKDQSLFSAWREAASLDCNPGVAGIKGWKKLVRSLPADPLLVIKKGIFQLGIGEEEAADVLYALLLSVGGWAGHLQFLAHEKNLIGEKENTLVDLLAIRMVYEMALQYVFGQSLRSNFKNYSCESRNIESASLPLPEVLWQRAHECAMQRELFGRLNKRSKNSKIKLEKAPFQAVFCIDVRSEIYRRSLEQVVPEAETVGFAGFFGFPIEVVPAGESVRKPQAPVLIKPNIQVFEHSSISPSSILFQKKISSAWASFKASAVSSFVFVELAGLGFFSKIIKSLLHCSKDSSAACSHRSLDISHISIEKQTEMAAGALRHMGLAKGSFAKIVLLCGHGSRSENNPYRSSLDCGACGGHSGEVNARTAATILNNPDVRLKLVQRGINIPVETLFVAGLHNTTTDNVTLFEGIFIPESHQEDVRCLNEALIKASLLARKERAPLLGLNSSDPKLEKFIHDRSVDWSQVLPEWGLAGNYAFIAAPREVTRGIDLAGRVFLHDYNYDLDEEEATLELILSAPVVVASWINLQYYGSTVDNQRFGSGDKTIHHVAGMLGVIEGNGGDIKTGLPLQSLHDGKNWMHEPLRLHVCIQAPKEAIERILKKHPSLANLVSNRWIHLFAASQDFQTFKKIVL